jgi:hypothetical protein
MMSFITELPHTADGVETPLADPVQAVASKRRPE